MELGIFIFWLILAVLVGVYASSKGRSGVGFFFVAVLLSPIVGFIIALVVQPIHTNTDAKALRSGEYKKCPYCAELVKSEAVVCKHCGRDLPAAPAYTNPRKSEVTEVKQILSKEDFQRLLAKSNESRFSYLLNRWYEHKETNYALRQDVPATVVSELRKYLNRGDSVHIPS